MKAAFALALSLLLPQSLPAQTLGEGVSYGDAAFQDHGRLSAAYGLAFQAPSQPQTVSPQSITVGGNVRLNWQIELSSPNSSDAAYLHSNDLALSFLGAAQWNRNVYISTGVEIGMISGNTSLSEQHYATKALSSYAGLRLDARHRIRAGQTLSLGLRLKHALRSAPAAPDRETSPNLEFGVSHRLQW